jgi:hypothetical protein
MGQESSNTNNSSRCYGIAAGLFFIVAMLMARLAWFAHSDGNESGAFGAAGIAAAALSAGLTYVGFALATRPDPRLVEIHRWMEEARSAGVSSGVLADDPSEP